MSRPRVALATCATWPALDTDDALALPLLQARGIDAAAVVWNDPSVDWGGFDVVVLRSTWDYVGRRDEFLAWAGSVPRLVNPADVVRWNTDKQYLDDLAAAGVPVVETRWLAPDALATGGIALPTTGEYVVKPAVSGGARDSGRYVAADPGEAALAQRHARRLLEAGRTVMVQPYQAAVDDAGETALIFLGGEYSHAVRKGALLTGPLTDAQAASKQRIRARRPSAREYEVAGAALAAVPGGAERLSYARVDLLPGGSGEPRVLELELTEPSLYLRYSAGAAERLVDAIADQLAR